jgi:ABC-type oligopeptide transport system ATPase subunit
MSGIATICIGKRGCGKTTISKTLLDIRPKQMPCIIYDINNEYHDYYAEPFEDFEIFLLKISSEDIRKTYILIEEATIFFSTRSRYEEMMNVLVRARHTGNIIQLNFHSFSSVPKNIYHLLDYVIIFKTNDTLKDVTDRFDKPDVLKAFKEAQQSNNDHFYKLVKLY